MLKYEPTSLFLSISKDLISWNDTPEDFAFDDAGEAWKYQLRVCRVLIVWLDSTYIVAIMQDPSISLRILVLFTQPSAEHLLRSLVHEFPDKLAPYLLTMAQEAITYPNTILQAALYKDAGTEIKRCP